ncbi:MAG: queuosine precursor transporter [Saprospiraceae bacterium]
MLEQPQLLTKPVKLLLVLTAFFIANTIVAEFIGTKIFSLEALFGFSPLNLKIFGVEGLGLNLTAGVILWPVVFVMTDIINEYYGEKVVRFLSYLAVGIVVFAFVMVYLSISLPPNEWWQYQSGTLGANSIPDMQVAFKKIMGQGLWIIVGSMVAFLFGQILDVFIFHKIKAITGEGRLWLRATGSTLVSQAIDSYIVLLIAFWIGSDWELSRILAIGTVNYIYKGVVAIFMTPIIYFIHDVIENYLGHSQATLMKSSAMKA